MRFASDQIHKIRVNPSNPRHQWSMVRTNHFAGAASTTDDADPTDLHGYYAFTSDMPAIGN